VNLKRILLALMTALLPVVLSGCMMSASVEDLYTLPQLPEEYQGLSVQIEGILASGAEYTSPTAGTNLQSVQLEDLDGDGTEEALAFFRTETNAYQVYVFRQVDGQYLRIGMAEGYGSTLRAIYYPTLGNGKAALAMCWGFDEGGSYGMTVYGFGNTGMSVLMDIRYSDVVLRDINGDGSEEMAFAIRDTVTGLYSARIYQYQKDQYRVLCDVPMCLEVRSVANMQFGTLENGQVGLYVDSNATTGGYVTDLICYDGQTAYNRTIDQASGSGTKTWRLNAVYCSDIDGDGRVDVPAAHVFSYEPNEVEARARVDWYNFDRDGLSAQVGSTVHAVAENWYFQWPDRWGDQVRIGKGTDTNLSKTIFSVLNSDGTSEDLLVLWFFSGGGREEEAALYRQLEALTSNASGIYRFSLERTESALDVTSQEVRVLFHTIETGWHSEEY